MDTHPLLFDLGARQPTTRDIADTVRLGGADALTEAERRADHARYQEISCRSALNAVKGMPFAWTLNPYRGCTHGCHYCYARRYHAQFEMNADDEFASVILVKKNIVDVLTRELARPSWKGEYVAVGTATDCYQPIEGHYKLTRRSLEAFLRARNPIGLITKGPMVVRDRDLLVALSRVASCAVYMSVPTVDEDAWQRLEPGTAHPLQRLRAVRELVDAGVNAGVLMNPIVPGFTSSRAKLERTVKAIADHGAAVRRLQRDVPRGRHARALHEVSRARHSRRGCRATRRCIKRNTRRATTVRRCRGWCACCRIGTASRNEKRRTRNIRPRPPRPKPSRSASPGDNDQRRTRRTRRAWLTRRVQRLLRYRRDPVRPPPGHRRPPRSLRARCRRGSTARTPSVTLTSKCEPSFQRALIGSLMCSSMKRFRNRAPNAML